MLMEAVEAVGDSDLIRISKIKAVHPFSMSKIVPVAAELKELATPSEARAQAWRV